MGRIVQLSKIKKKNLLGSNAIIILGSENGTKNFGRKSLLHPPHTHIVWKRRKKLRNHKIYAFIHKGLT
jgi:hypothetical protein